MAVVQGWLLRGVPLYILLHVLGFDLAVRIAIHFTSTGKESVAINNYFAAATVSFPNVVQEDVGSVDVCFHISDADRIPAQGVRINLRLVYPSSALYSWEHKALYGGRHTYRCKQSANLLINAIMHVLLYYSYSRC